MKSGKIQGPGPFSTPSRKMPQFPLSRRLDGLQRKSGRLWKRECHLLMPRFKLRNFQSVANYCTKCATPPPSGTGSSNVRTADKSINTTLDLN